MTTTQTIHPEKEEKKRQRPTLDERIKTATEKLTAKEAERAELAKALRSLKASKMNKDRNKKRKTRAHELILMGTFFEEILGEIGKNFINQCLTNTTLDIKNLKEELKNTDLTNNKKTAKELEDKKIILKRLETILKETETENSNP